VIVGDFHHKPLPGTDYGLESLDFDHGLISMAIEMEMVDQIDFPWH